MKLNLPREHLISPLYTPDDVLKKLPPFRFVVRSFEHFPLSLHLGSALGPTSWWHDQFCKEVAGSWWSCFEHGLVAWFATRVSELRSDLGWLLRRSSNLYAQNWGSFERVLVDFLYYNISVYPSFNWLITKFQIDRRAYVIYELTLPGINK